MARQIKQNVNSYDIIKINMLIDNIEFIFLYKKVKHLRLTIKEGKASVSIPLHMKEKEVMKFIRAKMHLVKKYIDKCAYTHIEYSYSQGETIYIWSNEHTLNIIISKQNKCQQNGEYLDLYVTDDRIELKKKVIDNYLRKLLQQKAEMYLQIWQHKTGIYINQMRIKNMKTRWGSCNIQAKRVWLNLKLAYYDEKCLSYVVLHEILHIIEKSHNKRFYSLLDSFFPEWRAARKALNGGY